MRCATPLGGTTVHHHNVGAGDDEVRVGVRQGIGKALIREGLSRLREMNAGGCCLVGHPDYHGKLGFKNVPGLVYEGVPAAGRR
jgi:hypothetical protein